MIPCPDWCAGGHRCTAAGGGEHRSDPHTWLTPYGTLVVTRIREARGQDRLEIRAVVDLPADQAAAHHLGRLLTVGVDLTVRALLAGRLARVRAAYRRATGARVR